MIMVTNEQSVAVYGLECLSSDWKVMGSIPALEHIFSLFKEEMCRGARLFV